MNDEIKTLKPTYREILNCFPQGVEADAREGYAGLLVDASKLINFVETIKDDFGYDFLTSVTGVDYLPEEKMEVVYHFFKSTGGSILEIKVQVPRSNPTVPSLVDLYPGAAFQEREAYDLLGIRFEGHPNLRRILMWEGFEGHPLQKDWREAFYEGEYQTIRGSLARRQSLKN